VFKVVVGGGGSGVGGAGVGGSGVGGSGSGVGGSDVSGAGGVDFFPRFKIKNAAIADKTKRDVAFPMTIIL